MNYTSNVKQYINQINTDILPPSELEKYRLNRIGLYSISEPDITMFKVELGDSSHLYPHEKCTPDRVGIRDRGNKDKFYPTYFRYFNDAATSSLGKILVNSALNIYPTPLQSYGMILEGSYVNRLGTATIDLNHLQDAETNEKIDSIRLDFLLHSLGLPYEIDSFYAFQKMIESGKLSDKLTPRAIVQLGLSSIFIPNAIGETDANSRNVILLKDKTSDKYDIVVRIDAEANTYLNEQNRQRSGKKRVPKGIYSANEEQEEFLKTIKSKDISIDWELFYGFNILAKELCSRTRIDNAITRAYMKNSGKLVLSEFDRPSPYASAYNADAFFEFSSETIDRANRFFNNIFGVMGMGGKDHLPFAEPSRKYNGICVDDMAAHRLVQRAFNKDGKGM